MASRTKQKEEARARRLAEESARDERERRQRRLRMLAGVVLAAIAVVAVAIVISSSGGSGKGGLKTGTTANQTISGVNSLLAGIPQSGNTLGSPNAKVTVTEYGDLQCPVCRDFALSSEQQLIANDVRSGKVKLVFRSLETATGNSPNPQVFVPQQAAALAAGNQRLAWQYILLFYKQQGQEGTGYVNDAYLNGLAHQVTGLDFARWNSDRTSSSLASQVNQDEQTAGSLGYNSTPTIVVQGPKGQAQPIVGDPSSYSQLEQVINSVQ
jgi:protein-disulfide isomerase